MAQKYHPDKAGDDEKALEKFKAISNAYEVLVDPDQRKKYDRLKAESSQKRTAGGGYNSRKAGGPGQARGGGKRDRQDDHFYGDFGSKDDFYDYYSNFQGKSKQTGGQQKSHQYSQGTDDFYGTNRKPGQGSSRRQRSQQQQQTYQSQW